MALFDRSHTTYYQSAIVTIALSCIISEIRRDIGRNRDVFISLAVGVLSCCLMW